MKKIKQQSILVLCILFANTIAYAQTSLNFVDSYSISDDVSEPSGLAYDKLNNQLFSVSDTGDIYRLSTTGRLLDTYDLSGDLEGVSTYNTPNTLLVAIEDTYEIIEYNYVTENSVSHTMEYENQGESNSGIEGVTYNENTGEIYFLNEKDPGALIVANSNFNVTDEFELTFADDYSASYYVSETNELWLGSDDESEIYRCNTDGSVIETFNMRLDGDELDKIEGIAIDYSNKLLYIVTDGGGELLVYEIESEETENDTLTVTSVNDFDAVGNSQTITVTSNIDWRVSESSPWISLNRTNGSDNGNFTITASENNSTSNRSAAVTITGNDITRSIIVFQDGAEEEEISNTDNLALNGNASQSSTGFNGVASRAIDGNTNGNFFRNSVTHTNATTGSWWQVELDSQTNIGDIIIYNRTNNCCVNRLSNFTVFVYDRNNNEVFRQTITEAPTPSVTINAGGALGNTIQIVTNLTNTALSLAEVEVYAGEPTSTPFESCSEGTNLAENGTIADFSAEQNSTNTVQNILEENGRWSALTFPQYATIDLGDNYSVNEIILDTFQDRDYHFIIDGSTTSATSGFSTLVDASDNRNSGPITETFSAQTVRYVRLTVTGADSYDGPWASINQLQVICAGTRANKSILEQENALDLLEVATSPNPFTNSITVNTKNNNQHIGSIRLTDLTGQVIIEEAVDSDEFTLNNLDAISNGMYLLVILSNEDQIINTIKVIKE